MAWPDEPQESIRIRIHPAVRRALARAPARGASNTIASELERYRVLAAAFELPELSREEWQAIKAISQRITSHAVPAAAHQFSAVIMQAADVIPCREARQRLSDRLQHLSPAAVCALWAKSDEITAHESTDS